MTECTIRAHESVSIDGLGDIDFGDSVAAVQAVLGSGGDVVRQNGRVQLFVQDGPERRDRQLSVRFDFDENGKCAAVEFLSPRTHAPVFAGQRLAGPTLREGAEAMIRLGHEPWADDGPVGDLAAACAEGGSADTLYFHTAGISLWTEMGTETDEHGELGEVLLDTVYAWRRGHWAEANERWAEEGLSLHIALPE